MGMGTEFYCAVMEKWMEAVCAVTDGDGDRVSELYAGQISMTRPDPTRPNKFQ